MHPTVMYGPGGVRSVNVPDSTIHERTETLVVNTRPGTRQRGLFFSELLPDILEGQIQPDSFFELHMLRTKNQIAAQQWIKQ